MIIDFHTHVFPDKIAGATIAALAEKAGETPSTEGTAASLAKHLSECGVDLAINLPVLTRPTQFDSVFRFAEELNTKRRATGAPILSFAGAHPKMDDIEEKMHAVKEAGFLGVKVHPDYQDTPFDDEGYVRILKAAKAEDLIVVTHAGLDAAYVGQHTHCTPDSTLRLLWAVDGYDKLVLAHYGARAMADEVYEKLAGEDVYFDTAYILSETDKETFLKILDKHGDDKVLFATDSPWQNIGKNIATLKSFELGEKREEKIFSSNARRLLGI